MHSVGGASVINDWCRNNNSYGFDPNSMRLSERVSRRSGQTVQRQIYQGQPEQQQSVYPITVFNNREDKPLDYNIVSR